MTVFLEVPIINQFGHDLTIEEAAYISASHGWYQPGGGTSPDVIGNMMDYCNIPNHTVMNATIADLAHELQQGHGVIVGVNSEELWQQGPLAELWQTIKEAFGWENPADHAIVVTGIDVSDPENPQVIINDSGHPDGNGARYPLDQFVDAWENSGFYYTATDTPMPGTDTGILDSIDFSKWISAIAGVATFVETGDVTSAGIAYNFVDTLFSDPNIIALI